MLVCTLWDTCGSSFSGFRRFVTASNFRVDVMLGRLDVSEDEVDVDDEDDDSACAVVALFNPLAPSVGSRLAAEAIGGFTARRRFVAVTTLVELLPPVTADFLTAMNAGALPKWSPPVVVPGSGFLLLMSCSGPRLRLRVSRAASSSESAFAIPPLTTAVTGAESVVAEADDPTRIRAGGCTFSMLLVMVVEVVMWRG